MRIEQCHWKQVEDLLKTEDRCILPLGCTEQHAYLSLATDSILAEKLSVDIATPLGVPVFPVLSYGITPNFRAYPGTVSLRMQTYLQIIEDVLESLFEQGFRRILVVNGHGGNSPARAIAGEWLARKEGVRLIWHDWWIAPKTWAKVQEIDPVASHASWMENFPWTRLEGVNQPNQQKPMVDLAKLRQLNADEVRHYLGDGNFGGLYQRSDEEMLSLWQVAVEETRQLLVEGWAD